MRVLIGHLDTELPPYDTARFEVRVVRYRPDGQLPASRIAEMLEQCPPGWKPDVYYHASAVHFPLPSDIETFDGLTATNIQDWHRGGRAVWAAVGFFDLILTERNSGALLRASGYENTRFCRLWGVRPELHRTLPEIKKDIDILFIGSLNPAVWEERNRWVARLARLSPRYRVVIAMGHYGEHYVRLTNRAKIVFNRSVNGCTNQRAYDGLACGALVFNEEENAETQEILEDRVHCVYYNAENFEDLLDYYLTHDAERERIVAQGRERVLAAHTEAAHFHALLETLEANLAMRHRPNAALPRAERAWRKAFQIYSASLPAGAEQGLARLAEAEEAGFEPGRIQEARAALHGWVAHYLPPGNEKVKLFSTALEFARQAVQANPYNPFAQTTLAFLLLERAEATQGRPPTGRNDILEAAVALSQAAEMCERWLFESEAGEDELTGFGYPRWADSFDCRLERAYLARAMDPAQWKRETAAALAWRCRSMLSDLAAANDQREEALRQARAAAQDIPTEAEALFRLARCEALNGNLADAVTYYQQGLALSPLSYPIWPEYMALLSALNEPNLIQPFREDCQAIIDAIPTFAGIRAALDAAEKQ
jgi:tetratricopeptide (TPR) repeat protein